MSKQHLPTLAAFIVGALLAGAVVAGDKQKQPHMKDALHALEKAKDALQSAEADKGGHRAKAIDLVNQALVEVKAGMEFDNKH